ILSLRPGNDDEVTQHQRECLLLAERLRSKEPDNVGYLTTFIGTYTSQAQGLLVRAPEVARALVERAEPLADALEQMSGGAHPAVRARGGFRVLRLQLGSGCDHAETAVAALADALRVAAALGDGLRTDLRRRIGEAALCALCWLDRTDSD